MCSCALTLTCRLCLQEPYFSSVTRVRRAVCSCVVLLIFGGAAAAGLCYMLAHMKGSDPMAPRWVLDLCVALLMQLINRAGGRLAARLTAWENYRTDAAHAKALVYKTCLVQFLPSYLPLAFVAFAMASAEMHRAVGLEAEQNCVPVERDGDGVFRPSCIHELAAVVPVVLVVHVLAWLLEVGLTLWLDRPPQRKRGDQLPLQAEAEAAMPRSDGVVFAGYNNLALQFGWVAFFGAAWPLAGAVAACSAAVQIRLHAKGFCTLYQRPAPQGCRGIGAWQWVFVTMGCLAVLSNGGLVFFSSNIFTACKACPTGWERPMDSNALVGSESGSSGEPPVDISIPGDSSTGPVAVPFSVTSTYALLMFLAAEHVILLATCFAMALAKAPRVVKQQVLACEQDFDAVASRGRWDKVRLKMRQVQSKIDHERLELEDGGSDEYPTVDQQIDVRMQ